MGFSIKEYSFRNFMFSKSLKSCFCILAVTNKRKTAISYFYHILLYLICSAYSVCHRAVLNGSSERTFGEFCHAHPWQLRGTDNKQPKSERNKEKRGDCTCHGSSPKTATVSCLMGGPRLVWFKHWIQKLLAQPFCSRGATSDSVTIFILYEICV